MSEEFDEEKKAFKDVDEIIEDEEDEGEIIKDDNEVIDSSLEIGGQIHQQSAIIKKFVQLPKDVKYSKFNRIDIANFTLKSRTYGLYKYMHKVEIISKKEIEDIKEIKKEIYYIETLEEFKDYLENTNKAHIWYNLNANYTKDELLIKFEILKEQLKTALKEGVLESVYSDKVVFNNAYEQYLQASDSDPNIDDYGLMCTMMTLTEVNKASGGWATKQMNTTINITKEENLRDEAEEDPESSERNGSTILNKFKKK